MAACRALQSLQVHGKQASIGIDDMVKTVGFILMIMQPGFVAGYDDVTGSRTGVFESASDCRAARSKYYDYANEGSIVCVAVMVRENKE